MDAFEQLGVRRTLIISHDQIQAAFRKQGKVVHPDAGGTTADFEQLEAAKSIVGSAARRLEHWLNLRGKAGSLRGEVSDDLMTLFTAIGPVLQRADQLLREREAATTSLGKALLERQVLEVRGELEEIQAQLGGLEDQLEANFAQIEAGAVDGWKVARELAFVEKWKSQVRERFGGLW